MFIEYMVDKEDMPVIIMGDFNEVLYKSIDRFPPRVRSESPGVSRLSNFLEEAGLMDMWRERNPNAQQYSYFSSSYSILSRIDMALGNGEALQNVKNIVYLPREVSDHLPLVLSLSLEGKRAPGIWKISPLWLELMKNAEEVSPKLKEFIELNVGTAPISVIWDTLKAFLRGILIQQEVKIKQTSRG